MYFKNLFGKIQTLGNSKDNLVPLSTFQGKRLRGNLQIKKRRKGEINQLKYVDIIWILTETNILLKKYDIYEIIRNLNTSPYVPLKTYY